MHHIEGHHDFGLLEARLVDLIRGLRAGDWVREAAGRCGGSGGGRPEMAQAGGKDPSKVQEAAATARRFAEEVLS